PLPPVPWGVPTFGAESWGPGRLAAADADAPAGAPVALGTSTPMRLGPDDAMETSDDPPPVVVGGACDWPASAGRVVGPDSAACRGAVAASSVPAGASDLPSAPESSADVSFGPLISGPPADATAPRPTSARGPAA